MRLLAKQAPVINLGNEKVLREYLYIDDVVKAYLHLAENIETLYGDNNSNMPSTGTETYGWPAFNISSYTTEETNDLSNCPNIRNVKDVIDTLREKVSNIEAITIPKPANFIEIPDQYLDASKIKQLGFTPEIPFNEGIDLTLAWYKKNYLKLEKVAYKYIH